MITRTSGFELVGYFGFHLTAYGSIFELINDVMKQCSRERS